MSGAFNGRREDLRLVTGQGRYTADWNLPGQAYGYFLRSDRAHAEIVAIDTAAASRAPGVLGVFCGEDLAQGRLQEPAADVHFKGKDGTVIKVPHRHALAQERVRFVGEPVALVVAESESGGAGRRRADRRRLSRPAGADRARGRARAGGAAHPCRCAGQPRGRLRVRQPRRRPMRLSPGRRTSCASTLRAQRIAGNPMEPKACVTAYDPAPACTTSTCRPRACPASEPSSPTSPASRASSFGSTPRTSAAHSACATKSIRNSPRSCWRRNRSAGRSNGSARGPRSIVSDHHGRGVTLTGELALDRDGNFLAMRIGWLVNLGAYCSNAGPVHQYRGVADQHGGQRLPHARALRIEPAGLHQRPPRAPPIAAPDGPACPICIERLVDEAARQTGIDRIELRRRNLLAQDAFPYKTPTGSTYDSGDPPGAAGAGAGGGGLERLRAPPRRGESARQAARHRLRDLHRAVRRRRPGGDRDPVRRRRPRRALHECRGRRARATRPCFPISSPTSSGWRRRRSRCATAIPTGRRLAGTGSFGSRSLISHGGAFVGRRAAR